MSNDKKKRPPRASELAHQLSRATQALELEVALADELNAQLRKQVGALEDEVFGLRARVVQLEKECNDFVNVLSDKDTYILSDSGQEAVKARQDAVHLRPTLDMEAVNPVPRPTLVQSPSERDLLLTIRDSDKNAKRRKT